MDNVLHCQSNICCKVDRAPLPGKTNLLRMLCQTPPGIHCMEWLEGGSLQKRTHALINNIAKRSAP